MGICLRSFKPNEHPSEKNEQKNGHSECISPVRKLALDTLWVRSDQGCIQPIANYTKYLKRKVSYLRK